MYFRLAVPLLSRAFLILGAIVIAGSQARPAESERASAFSGYGYTVIARVFLGDGGNLSYLRFLNLSGSTSSVTATIVGSPSGRNYGSVNVGIPNHASRQIPITQFMSDVGISGLTSPDDRLGVYLRSDGSPVAVQHVLYSEGSGFFENMSTCQNSSVSDSNAALMNVHTTSISEYESFVTIYNYTSAAASHEIQVYEAASGAFKGQVTVSVDANSTFEQRFGWFERQLDWTPSSTEYHANLLAFPQSGSRGALVFHTVFNNRLGAFLNLTNFCTIESSRNMMPVANSDNISGAVVNQPFSIQFATLTTNDQNAGDGTLIDVTSPLSNSSVNGVLTQSGNDLTYTAVRAGIATFQYRVRAAAGTSSFATVTLNVSDGAPVTVGDRLTQTFTATNQSTILFSTLIVNDIGAAGASLTGVTAPLTEGAANGTLTQSGNDLSYTPARVGTVTFQYRLGNALGTSNAATVTLSVGAGDAPMVANDTLTQTFSAGRQSSIAMTTLTGNDRNTTDAILENVTMPITDGTGNGTISVARTNDSLSYTPARQGTATFNYQLRNRAGLSNVGTVTLTVTVTGDGSVPVAVDDTLTREFMVGTVTNIPFTDFIANDQNATGAAFALLTSPSTEGSINGSANRRTDNLQYLPERVGTVTFTYRLQSSAGNSNTAQVTLTVGAAALVVPVAVNDTLTRPSFVPNRQTTILLSALTANDRNTTGGVLENLSTPMTNGSANGNLTRTGDGILYTPARAGVVTFTYQIRTGAGISNPAVVTLTVVGGS